MSPIKQELLATIADAPDTAIEPTLQFLKSLLQNPSGPRPGSGRSILRHAGTWQGDDFDDCLQAVNRSVNPLRIMDELKQYEDWHRQSDR